MREQAKERFRRFQKKTGKYQDLDIEKVEFVEKVLDEMVIFLNSKRKPIKKSLRKAGKYPYYGASGITDYVEGFIFNDKLLLVSEDGENLKSRKQNIAFIVNGKFWVNNHAHILKPKKGIEIQYLKHLINANNLANSISLDMIPKLNLKNLRQVKLNFPKPYNTIYTSLELQKILVEFMEYYQKENERIFEIIQKLDELVNKMRRLLMPLFFAKENSVSKRFDAFCRIQNIDLKIEEIKFKAVSLQEICEITMGQSPSKSDLNTEKKGIPFHQGKTNFGDKYLLPPTSWTLKPKKKATANDILVSMRAPAGVINITEYETGIGRGLAAVSCPEDLDQMFIYYFLKNNEEKIKRDGDNSGIFSSITKGYLDNFPIHLPLLIKNGLTSLEIQSTIAAFFEKYYSDFNRKKVMIKRLKEIVLSHTQTLINQTFN